MLIPDILQLVAGRVCSFPSIPPAHARVLVLTSTTWDGWLVLVPSSLYILDTLVVCFVLITSYSQYLLRPRGSNLHQATRGHFCRSPSTSSTSSPIHPPACNLNIVVVPVHPGLGDDSFNPIILRPATFNIVVVPVHPGLGDDSFNPNTSPACGVSSASSTNPQYILWLEVDPSSNPPHVRRCWLFLKYSPIVLHPMDALRQSSTTSSLDPVHRYSPKVP
jgi:hypothetical protein